MLKIIAGQLSKRLVGYGLFALGWYILFDQILEDKWVTGLLGSLLIPVGLGVVVSARRKLRS
ncbi:MAG TPA: hypothetical protein DEZ08_01300 [Dehalococcoidia bacterium]|jgi:hypothetical protein|nr:hypothetical protein [Dehalococcoidia bacterium]|tara:strand:- start:3166 stop:3351 length:186 start_codon:yes stop_codon:yes gene_type:complete